jgi:DNA-binding MarR family transcriptional regulator/GNAT superfamily N-acetyltransferase
MTDLSPELVSRIRSASRRFVREHGFLSRTLAGTDLSPSAVHAILEIGFNDGLTAKDLSERLNLEKSTVSRLLKSLEIGGELRSTTDQKDRRAQILSLTEKGRTTFRQASDFADQLVRGALPFLCGTAPQDLADGLTAYADALASARTGRRDPGPEREVVEGYQTGMIGDISGIHARTHGPIVGSGPAFESVVSRAMAEFMPRLGNPVNNSWSVLENRRVVASITIDGEDLGSKIAHLRWFILEPHLRGSGLGRRLLEKALRHCDRHGFAEIQLWTLKGLEAARKLYELNGFTLADEYVGDQWGKAVVEQKFIRKRPRN